MCVFCRIVAGELPAEVVLDDEQVLAFLDHKPLFPGHVLVVPRAHVETLVELPPALFVPLMTAAQRIARAVVEGLGAQGSFVAMNNKISQSVPHLHVHVVPRSKGDGMKGFFWPRNGYRDAAHVEDVGSRLRAALR